MKTEKKKARHRKTDDEINAEIAYRRRMDMIKDIAFILVAIMIVAFMFSLLDSEPVNPDNLYIKR